MSLPNFNDDGLLPPGTYKLTVPELKASHLITGSSSYDDNWNSELRLRLVENAESLIKQLWEVGIEEIFLDGSFVEDKCHPGDIDGYYNCELDKLYQLIDKNRIWDMNNRTLLEHKPIMWSEYRVELYPNYGQPCGIRDEFGKQLQFPSAFRRTRENQQKGIIQIIKE